MLEISQAPELLDTEGKACPKTYGDVYTAKKQEVFCRLTVPGNNFCLSDQYFTP